METIVHRVHVASGHRSRSRAWLAAPAAAILTTLAICGPAAAGPTVLGGGATTLAPTPGSTLGPASQGFIMKDGSAPCDPITKRGCE